MSKETMDEPAAKRVDYWKVLAEIKKRRKLYFKVVPVVFVLACLYILCIPRTYQTDTEMIPEAAGEVNAGSSTLSSLASTFGFDMSSMESSDAITPMLYPDLMSDNGFVTSLFSIKVKTADGKVNTDYFTFLAKHQKAAWWNKIQSWVIRMLKPKKKGGGDGKLDPYNLPQGISDLAKQVSSEISIKVDKKTGAITISTTSQDPLVCKIIADSTRKRLEDFITEYRTKKAKRDYEYYKKLTADAHEDYLRQREAYADFADANEGLVLQSYRSKLEELENEMQLKFNAYTSVSAQMEAARAKVLAKTPVFTLIKGAAVPDKASAPKRMVFVLMMTILAIAGVSLYILRDIVLPKKGVNG